MKFDDLIKNLSTFLFFIIFCMGGLLSCISFFSVNFSKENKPAAQKKNKVLINFGVFLSFCFGIFMLFCCVLNPKWIDNVFLLEQKHQEYWDWLGNTSTSLISPEEGESFDPYVITRVDKDGFGAVSSDDIKYYIEIVTSQYPEAGEAIIRFSDGTGIDFFLRHHLHAIYGKIGEDGKVEYEKTVDLDKPLIDQIDGLTVISYEYDEYLYPIHEIHYDSDGNVVANADGVAEYFREFDRDGRILWERRLGVDGEPVVNSYGYAEYRREYSGDDVTREAYFDGKGNPVCRIDKGYSEIKFEYDASHNVICEQYYDTDGKPFMLSSGYSSVRREYDSSRNVISEKYYGVDGAPTLCCKGYSAVANVFDDNRRVIEQSYFGVDGQSVISTYGYANVKRVFDDKYVVEESYYGTDGKPLQMPGGYYGIRQIWYEGKLTDRIFLDAYGNPTERTDGYSRAIWGVIGGKWDVFFMNLNDQAVSTEGINLVKDVKFGDDGWSEWMTPQTDFRNRCFTIGTVNLGEVVEGDQYTCAFEIEFKGVTATDGQSFMFTTQGAQDGKWYTGNVWNNDLVYLGSAPEDGVYSYVNTATVSGDMTMVSNYEIGFRCDYWASGSFRVRYVKIEKGDTATPWSPGI